MRLEPELQREVARLTSLACDGAITEPEHARLESMLAHHPEARQFYYDFMLLHGELSWTETVGEASNGQSGQDSNTESPKEPVVLVWDTGGNLIQRGLNSLGSFSFFTTLAIGGFLLVGLIGIIGVIQSGRPDTASHTVAQLVAERDCIWGAGDCRPDAWGKLPSGRCLRLVGGLAEIEFADGARVVLEAPTTFEIRGGNAGFLEKGRLVATVPERAHGFTVETQTATVVDLGTDFGVSVAADGTAEMHVFKGNIEVTAKKADGKPAPVTAMLSVGEAARICLPTPQHTPRFEEIEVSSDQFVRQLPKALPPESLPLDPSSGGGRLIVSIDRRNGYADNKVPIGSFDGETDPLDSDAMGLQLDAPLFSDRVYVIDDMSRELAGADYVRTFLNDKYDAEGDYGYDITFSTDRDKVFLMVLTDDRFNRDGGNQQAAVDQIVSGFAKPGEFVKTGLFVDANDSRNPHPLSAFGKQVPTKDKAGNPIKYHFKAAPANDISTFVIAVLPEAPGTLDSGSDNKKTP